METSTLEPTSATSKAPATPPPFALFVRPGADQIDEAIDISAVMDTDFSQLLDFANPGADILVFVGANEREAASFTAGLDAAVIGDDNTYNTEVLPDGRHVVIVHYGDSPDSQVRVVTICGEVVNN